MRILVTLTLALVGVGQATVPPTPRPLDNPDAVAVYARMLQDEPRDRRGRVNPLVLRQDTAAFPGECKGLRTLASEWTPVVADYFAQNRIVRRFPSHMSVGVSYQLMPTNVLERSSNGSVDPWQAFADRYPDARGYVGLSAVGFDAMKTHALVYIEHLCGYLCGDGTYRLLHRDSGAWEPEPLTNSPCVWES